MKWTTIYEIQALFKDQAATSKISSTFKALKMVTSNSSTFQVFKHPCELCHPFQQTFFKRGPGPSLYRQGSLNL